MEDFASTALYNLIAFQLQKFGMSAEPSKRFEGKMERTEKADLLAFAIESHGASSVVQIGQGIRSIKSEPTLAVLFKADSPQELLDRWQRLERYYHGRHRVRVLDQSSNSVTIEHYSTKNSAPSTGEDLVIAGLLAALLQRIGCKALTLKIGDSQECIIKDDNITLVEPTPHNSAVWYLTWQRYEPPPPLIQQAPSNHSTAQKLSTLIRDDIGRSWRLSAAAKKLGKSTRSLQRSLAQGGNTFQRLLRTVRAEHAAALIVTHNYKLSEAGYACGYSDQAHFSREFRLRFNMSPTQFAEFTSAT